MSKNLGKIGYSIFTIFLAVTAIFFILRMSPGDPIEKILGPEATHQELSKYREQLGLHLPVSEQYVTYLKGIVKGDMGKSLFKKKDVSMLLKNHMGPTISLALISISLSTVLGVFLGVLAGFYKSKAFDNYSRVISLVALSFPIFSLAPILVFLFAIKLNVLPVSEWGGVSHAILPILTLVIPLSSIIMRVTRNKYLEEVGAPWVQVLTSKGMDTKAILLRVTKVCLPTILNVVAIQLSVVLAGTMITETIFDIPGMGMLLFEGIQNRDYPIVQGVIVYSTVIYMMVYFLVDFVNERIDPRIES